MAVNIYVLYQAYVVNACTGQPILKQQFYKFTPTALNWDRSRDRLIVMDSNTISLFDIGNYRASNLVAPDEASKGVAYVDSRSNYYYLGQPQPAPSIDEYDVEAEQIVRSFPISLPNTTKTTGLSAITFVPIEGHPQGGQFWIGSSVDGFIYVFDVPFQNATSQRLMPVGSFIALKGLRNVTALFYDEPSAKVYGLTDNWLFRLALNGTLEKHWLLGLDAPNGLAMEGNYIYLACYNCKNVWKFKFDDEDGISSGECEDTPKFTSGNLI